MVAQRLFRENMASAETSVQDFHQHNLAALAEVGLQSVREGKRNTGQSDPGHCVSRGLAMLIADGDGGAGMLPLLVLKFLAPVIVGCIGDTNAL